MLRFHRSLYTPIKRLLSTTTTTTTSPHPDDCVTIERLRERRLIRVSGTEASDYLQGLITNDIKQLRDTPGCIYTMFLNEKGRLLFDSIIYRASEYNCYYLECDKEVVPQFMRHLKKFRLRRKIDIVNLENDFHLYVAFNSTFKTKPIKLDLTQNAKNYLRSHHDLLIFKDPRVLELGYRIIALPDTDVSQQYCDLAPISDISYRNYRWLRYRLGVGEGVQDLQPGKAIPLECNCDYLNGVSFQKGCYIGQELMARVYHTGVIRKRLLPIHFTQIPLFSKEQELLHNGLKVGVFYANEGDVGLGLIRLDYLNLYTSLKIGDGIGKPYKPHWWPLEKSKVKTVQSLEQ